MQIKMNFTYHLGVDENIVCSLYKISSTSVSGNLGTLLPRIAASPVDSQRCSLPYSDDDDLVMKFTLQWTFEPWTGSPLFNTLQGFESRHFFPF